MGTCYSAPKEEKGEAITYSAVRGPRETREPRKHVYVNLKEDAKLFTDEEFPPISESYGTVEPVQWMRASRLAQLNGQRPKFFDANGATRFDVKQGRLGDCWFLAALSDLPTNAKLFKKVVPDLDNGTPQNFKNGNTKFAFRFWNYGEWVTVVVDDYLPIWNGELKCVHSGNTAEFWSALAEKAYAKLYGNYAKALCGGWGSEALEDLTGGISEEISLESWENQLEIFKKLWQAYQKKCLMTASVKKGQGTKRYGLPDGHAYSVNKVVQFKLNGKMVRLLRVRNPWGTSKEWTGDWSDNSPKWQNVSREIKDQLDFHRRADGEFFISLEDFIKMFYSVTICHLSLDSIDDSAQGWKMVEMKDSWAPKKSFYPSLGHFEYSHYLVKLEDTDEDGLCSLLISVMQQGARTIKGQSGESITDINGEIGFEVYRIDPKTDLPVFSDFFENAVCERAFMRKYKRSATQRLQLRPGYYVIVPKKNSACPSQDFLIRVCYEGDGFFKKL